MQLDLLVNVALEEFPDFHYPVVEAARIGRNDLTFRPHLAWNSPLFVSAEQGSHSRSIC